MFMYYSFVKLKLQRKNDYYKALVLFILLIQRPLTSEH